jgi:hypothetical protein
MNNKPAPQSVAPLTGKAETIAVITHLSGVMNELLAVIEQETELVRAGKLSEAAQLAQVKTDLAQQYMSDANRLKGNPQAVLASADIGELRQQHDLFQALLQVNLTVLATAHAVSEGIMRGVHDELARKSSPQVYGASGRTSAPPASASQPLTVSRVL